jgi:hypothetical protein
MNEAKQNVKKLEKFKTLSILSIGTEQSKH